MTIEEAMRKGMVELKSVNIESPKLKSRLLMQFILNKPRQFVIVNDKQVLDFRDEKRFFNLIDKMKNNIPLEHITHQREFMKLNFFVNENVLIPRQDTEVLVEEVLEIAHKINAKKILDLCTGSGAIAVSLAKYLPNCQIVATDISDEALKVAKKNARNNGVDGQITFINSDLFANLGRDKFDIVVSNPPYIKRSVIEKLDLEVKNEPYIALDGGYDGLKFYRKIVCGVYEFLKYKGCLCFEIGFDQKEDVMEIIEKEGKFETIYSKKDLCDMDRVVVAQLK